MRASQEVLCKRVERVERLHKDLCDRIDNLSMSGVVKRIDALGVHMDRIESELTTRLAHFFAVYVVCTEVGARARRLSGDAGHELMSACLWAMQFFDAQWWRDALREHDDLSIEEWSKVILMAHSESLASSSSERQALPWKSLSASVLGGAIKIARSASAKSKDRIEISECLDFLFSGDGGAQAFCDASGVDLGQLRTRLKADERVAANLMRWSGDAR